MSTIPAVLVALSNLSAATLPDWQVINGTDASVATTSGQLVLVGGDEVTGRRDLDALSLATTSEQYVVPMTVNADIPGTDQMAADTLALDAYELLERAIRLADLGVPGVLQALPTGDYSMRRLSDDNGRHAVVRFTVLVLAQNT